MLNLIFEVIILYLGGILDYIYFEQFILQLNFDIN